MHYASYMSNAKVASSSLARIIFAPEDIVRANLSFFGSYTEVRVF